MKGRGVVGYVLAAVLAGYLLLSPTAHSASRTVPAVNHVLASGTDTMTLNRSGVLTGVMLQSKSSTFIGDLKITGR